jgi:hypothetical protein
MNNKYLFDEEPKSFSPTLAKALGSISKAVIMQQIHFWIKIYSRKSDKTHFFKGFYWVFNSYAKWHKDLDFIPLPTMKRQILALEKDGLLISDDFNKNRGNRTKWYRIDYEKLLALTEAVGASDQNELASDQNELASDQNELASDQNELASDHFDPLCQSDHHIDQQSDQQREILEHPFSLNTLTGNKDSEQRQISHLEQSSDPNIQDPQTPKPLSPTTPENIGKPIHKSDRPASQAEERKKFIAPLLEDRDFLKYLFREMKRLKAYFTPFPDADYESHAKLFLEIACEPTTKGDRRFREIQDFASAYDLHRAEQKRVEQERLEFEQGESTSVSPEAAKRFKAIAEEMRLRSRERKLNSLV